MMKLKLLIVDDEKDFVDALAERLQLRGFQVLTAIDGEGALRIIEDDPPQLVILDIMMPGLSGLDVLQQIKERTPQIPVILLTGLGSTAEGTKGMHLGAYDFLIKPINIDELIQKMDEAARNARAHSSIT
jgi:two-component system, OmpR family, response regulator